MITRSFLAAWCAAGWLALAPPALAQENAGQAELDKATQKMVAAEKLDDLEEVIELCESALAKGLDEENTKYAKQLVVSARFQRATRTRG